MSSRRFLRPSLVGVPLALFMLVGVACGTSATPTPGPEASEGSSTQSGAETAPQTGGTPAPTAAPAATTAPSSGWEPPEKLTIALTDFGFEVPVGWRESAVAKHYMRFIYDSLVGLNDAGELDSAWGLAESWEMAPDGMQWTFKLKQGIKFHNGEEFTAADMKFTLGKLVQPESVAAYKERLTAFIGDVEQDVQTPDPQTLVVNLSQPNIWLQWDLSDSQGLLGMPQPKDYTEEVGDEGFASNPVGTGPYRFVEQRIGDFMELEAVQDHWREGTPAINTVVFRKIPEESTRIAALKAKEVDAISLSRERVPEVKGAGFKVFLREGQSIVGFYFHQQWDPVPVADIRVRKALNLAANREELCEFVFGGLCSPGAVYPVPETAPVIDPSLKPYPYDPEEARRLLREAGYEPGELQVTIHSYPRADVPEGPRMIEALAGYFQEVGVTANILATEYTKYREGRRSQTIPGEMGYLGAPNRPFAGFVGLMRSLQHSTSPFTSTHDPEFDRLIEEMENTLDPEVAKERFLDIYRRYYNQYTHLTLVDLDIPYAGNDNIPHDWNLSVRSWEPNWLDITRSR